MHNNRIDHRSARVSRRGFLKQALLMGSAALLRASRKRAVRVPAEVLGVTGLAVSLWGASGLIGVLLLVLTLLLSFTGYLLPWDQLAIWAVTVGSNMARATPLLGYEGPFAEFVGANPIYDARAFLFGGGQIGPHTLLRFYILHCIFIPLVASILMAVHFWRIRRDGFSGPSL